MRLVPALALMSSALALAACGGGGGSLTGGGTLSAAGMRANVNGVCSINDTSCVPAGSGGSGAASADPDGDGVSGDLDTDGDTGSGAGGNNTQLATGLKSLAIQKFQWKKPTLGETALAKISSPEFADEAATEAAILSAAGKPKQLLFAVDTNDGDNSKYSVPVIQNEYINGTRDTRWLMLGHYVVGTTLVETFLGSGLFLINRPDGTTVQDRNGVPVYYKPATQDIVYAGADPARGIYVGQTVDLSESFYWNQLVPLMNAKANGGTKDNYREYRAISLVDNRDEVLQVWSWKDSYAIAYGNQIGGGDPKQLVYTIGGNETTDMPLGGSATYSGRWVGNSKTSNWVKPDGADIEPNSSWMVQGPATFAADFATGEVSGQLNTETWTSYQDKLKAWYTWYAGSADPALQSIDTPSTPDYEFYDMPISLKGTIVAGTPVTTTTPTGPVTTPVNNAFTGGALFSNGWINSDNPMYGTFFGNNASEVTGAFTVTGVIPQPIGGSTVQLDARRAFITTNGAFNANCTDTAVQTCAPPAP